MTPAQQEVRDEEREAREALRRQAKMERGAERYRDRAWRERLRDVLRDTRARYPRCKCELHAGMSRDDLQSLGDGCTGPEFVCPRLDAVRRRVAA